MTIHKYNDKKCPTIEEIEALKREYITMRSEESEAKLREIFDRVEKLNCKGLDQLNPFKS